MKLIVVQEFCNRSRGDEINDPQAIADALLAYAEYVVAVATEEPIIEGVIS